MVIGRSEMSKKERYHKPDLNDFAKYEYNDDLYDGHLQEDSGYANLMQDKIDDFIGDCDDLLEAINLHLDLSENEQLIMSYYLSGEQLSTREIAKLTGFSKSTVSDAYHRVIKKAKKYIEKKERLKKMPNKQMADEIANYYSMLENTLDEMQKRSDTLPNSNRKEYINEEIVMRRKYFQELKKMYITRAQNIGSVDFDYRYSGDLTDLMKMLRRAEKGDSY